MTIYKHEIECTLLAVDSLSHIGVARRNWEVRNTDRGTSKVEMADVTWKTQVKGSTLMAVRKRAV